jgi:flagellar hook-associated protein 2
VTVSSEGDQLVGKSGFAFDGIRIRVENDFVGEAGTIRLNDGLGSSFTNLLDSFIGGEGLLDTRIGSFDSAISRLQSQIDRVNERATLLEDRLRSKFTNLEVTLGRLNATGDFLTAQLKTLPGFTKKD